MLIMLCSQPQATEFIQRKEICRDLQNELSAHSRCVLAKESEVGSVGHINLKKVISYNSYSWSIS